MNKRDVVTIYIPVTAFILAISYRFVEVEPIAAWLRNMNSVPNLVSIFLFVFLMGASVLYIEKIDKED